MRELSEHRIKCTSHMPGARNDHVNISKYKWPAQNRAPSTQVEPSELSSSPHSDSFACHSHPLSAAETRYLWLVWSRPSLRQTTRAVCPTSIIYGFICRQIHVINRQPVPCFWPDRFICLQEITHAFTEGRWLTQICHTPLVGQR